jgi:ETC complex I subunit conserved region
MLAKIYLPSKSAMQSGKAQTRKWRLEFSADLAPKSDALMGWTGSADPNGQVRLGFDSKEQAIAFARAHAIPHQVIEPAIAKRFPKGYGENFAFKRREPWSH